MDKLYTVRMYGSLGNTFTTEPIKVSADGLRDIFGCLVSRFGEEFRDTILEGAWHITVGERKSVELTPEDNFLSEELVEFPIEDEEIHIFPVIAGAGGRGVGQIILGVVLIVVAVVAWYFAPAIAGAIGTTAATVTGAAASLAISGVLSIAGGVMAMLTKVPSVGDYSGAAGAAQKPSFIFNGVVNNTEQGLPVPIVYGRHLTGSTVLSAGMDVHQAAT